MILHILSLFVFAHKIINALALDACKMSSPLLFVYVYGLSLATLIRRNSNVHPGQRSLFWIYALCVFTLKKDTLAPSTHARLLRATYTTTLIFALSCYFM